MSKGSSEDLLENGNFDEEFEKLMGFSRYGKKLDNKLDMKKVYDETKIETSDTIVELKSKVTPEIDYDDFDTNPGLRIPASNVVKMRHGTKMMSAVTTSPNGAKMATGGHDYFLRLWDFNTMDSALRSHREVEPLEHYSIKHLQYNISSEQMLVCGVNRQVRIYDNDGAFLTECCYGDPYVRDVKYTKGHCSNLYGACWNPRELNQFVTCSYDGTLRLWRVEECQFQCDKTIKFQTNVGRPSPVTACVYSTDGWSVHSASNFGSVQSFDTRKKSNFPTLHIKNSHSKGFNCSSLALDHTSNILALRTLDDRLTLFDIRKPQSPLHTIMDIPNCWDDTRCVFSPDSRLIVTGSSYTKTEPNGKLLFYSAITGKLVTEFSYPNRHILALHWPGKLNQVFVGDSEGEIYVYFDPKLSHNGVLKCIDHTVNKREHEGEHMIEERIYLPLAKGTPMDEEPDYFRQKSMAYYDKAKSRKPDVPVFGNGCGGRITTVLSNAAYLFKELGLSKKDDDDDNPREAILKYAKVAEENPMFIGQAYRVTQPKPIFADRSEVLESSDEESDGFKKPTKRTMD